MKMLKVHLVWGNNIPPPSMVDFRDASPDDAHVKFNRKTIFKIPIDANLQSLLIDVLPELNKSKEVIDSLLKDNRIIAMLFGKNKATIHFGIWDE